MKVVLLKDIQGVGTAGQVKEVAAGYARNYLLPRGLAEVATPAVLEQLEARRNAEARRAAKEESSA